MNYVDILKKNGALNTDGEIIKELKSGELSFAIQYTSTGDTAQTEILMNGLVDEREKFDVVLRIIQSLNIDLEKLSILITSLKSL